HPAPRDPVRRGVPDELVPEDGFRVGHPPNSIVPVAPPWAGGRRSRPTMGRMSKVPLAVVLAAARTPIGTFGGAFKDVSAVDLGAAAAREVLSRSGVAVTDVDDVFMGCVLQAGAGMNVARQVALKAGLPVTVPAETVNRVCGSGLQAVVHAVESIRGGYAEAILAGGTESMSRAPYVLKNARWGLRLGHGEVEDTLLGDGLSCAIESCHMG